jgi:pimeloyl-ACP methyl ester carboxylesterase
VSPGQVVSGSAKVDGTQLYYEFLGNGEPLVLIHGGLIDLRMWDDQFEFFAQHYRVIRYDVRGHGRSPSPPGAYRDDNDLAALLKHLGVERAHVMGLSLGGRIAVDFALMHPEMVISLIPVAPGLSGYSFTADELKENREGLNAAYARGDYDAAVEFFQRSWTDGPRRTPEQVDPEVRERVRAMAIEGIQPGKKLGQSHWPNPPAIGRLSEVRVPTLVIVGDLDMPDIHTIVDLLMEGIPGAKKVTIPGAAHMVNMEQPNEFNQAVLKFLSEQ